MNLAEKQAEMRIRNQENLTHAERVRRGMAEAKARRAMRDVTRDVMHATVMRAAACLKLVPPPEPVLRAKPLGVKAARRRMCGFCLVGQHQNCCAPRVMTTTTMTGLRLRVSDAVVHARKSRPKP